jgi:putative ABC transport system permease protein
LFISKLRPVSIIKSFQTFRINPRFSKVLVVAQYTSCVVMMVAALVINRQMKFVAGKDLDFDKEQVVLVQNPGFDAVFTKRVRERLHDFAKSEPSVLQYSCMNGGLDGGGNRSGFMLNGERTEFTRLSVGYDYFEMLKIPFLQGRSFSEKFSSDTARTSKSVVVNETLFNLLGSDARLGVFNKNIEATIIGVVKDYHFASLNKTIEPEVHSLLGDHAAARFMFKIKAGEIQPAIEKIQKQWKSITNNYPFEYTFLDQTITKMYEADLIWQKTIQSSCFFAIFIACMGLFGLSAINAINRTREIGIRKVLGAGVGDLVGTLSKSFLAMIVIAILIAIPFSWWIMNAWLGDFAYRITITWWMFALVGCSAIAIAWVTVSFQAVKAALANPVNSLRSD